VNRASCRTTTAVRTDHPTAGYCVPAAIRLTKGGRSRWTRAILLLSLLLSAVTALAQTPAVSLLAGGTITSFPETAIGSESATQNIVIAINSSLTISSISAPLSQGGVKEFALGAVSGWGCAVDGVTVNNPGSVCTVPVTFQPSYPGVRQTPLIVETSAGNFQFGLVGIGRGPQAALLPGIINTVAGNGSCTTAGGTTGCDNFGGDSGDGGPATSATLNAPNSIALDSAGNIYIADTFGETVRKMSPVTGIITTVAGIAFPNPASPTESGDGGPASEAGLPSPIGIALDSAGNLYIADGSARIREVFADTGIINTIAGNGTYGYSGDGGPATSAELASPGGIAVDSAGNLYIADGDDNVIRKVTAATGIITTVAGNGYGSPNGALMGGYNGDGIPATSAELWLPANVAVDAVGNLYISDCNNQRIRKVTASTGIITTVAGTGNNPGTNIGGFSGDGGPATSADMNLPQYVGLDAAGNLYIADFGNNVFRKVDAATGIISTIIGIVPTPSGIYEGFSGDGGPATSAQLMGPAAILVDPQGNIDFADSYSNRIRQVSPTTPPLSFSPPSITVGSDSATQTFAVADIGNASLNISAIAAGANFDTDNNSTTCSTASALSSGGSCLVGALFSPTTTGPLTGTFTLTDNSLNVSGSTQQVGLSGTGVAPTLVSIAVTPATPSLAKGQTQQFTATGTYSDSSTQNLTASVTWASATPTAVTITAGGLATGTGQGTSLISATSGSVSGSTVLTVTAATLVSIAVTPANPSIAKGQTQQFTATGTYSDSSTQNLTASVTWASATLSTATITAGGLATGAGQGTSIISATSGSVSGSTVLTVTAATLVSIAVTPANPSIAKGQTQQFSATGTYSDSSTQNLTASVTWASATTSMATISAGGLATGAGQGTSIISATSGSVSGSTVLTVSAATLVSIAVTPASPSIAKGQTQQFSATGTYSDSSTQNLTSSVTWASATTGTATITAGGLATGVGTGTNIISATSGSVSGTTVLTVTAPALVSIAVTPANPSIAKGHTQQFTATGTYSDGSAQNLTASVAWVSATPATATIAAGGLATGVGAGTSMVSATSGSVSGSTVLTVSAATLVSIAVTPSSPSIAKGQTQQFAATGTYSDGSTQNLTASVTWASATTSTATITSGGLATGAGQGSSSISATSGSVSGSTVLTVLATVQVTVGTTPAGLSFSVDGNAYTTTQSLTWTVGSSHTIATTSPQTSDRIQNTFAAWSDAGAISHSVTASTGTSSYTAKFNTAYQLTTTTSPASGGTVSPVTGKFYAAGTVVPLSATANSGYKFSNWSGSVASSTSATTSITMNAPETVTANFISVSAQTSTTLTSSPNPSCPNDRVTFTATVTSATGTPTGSVEFMEGTKVLGTASLVKGKATFTTAFSSTGTFSITAVYGGTSSYLPSTSKTLSQLVKR
jgi:uncharacterized protein YjdB